MDIELIDERYRGEMVGSFRELAKMVSLGQMDPKQFMDAQLRIYQTYRLMTLDRQRLAVMMA